MTRQVLESDFDALEAAVRRHRDGANAQQIARDINATIPMRTLQFRLQRLVQQGRLAKEGDRRWAKFRIADGRPQGIRGLAEDPIPATEPHVPLSDASADIVQYTRRPVTARKPVGYNREFLATYRPNVTAYLSRREREHLARIGGQPIGVQPAGTYARQVLGRLLIDLSWNSSRLEGNTYSLLDSKRLIEFGEESRGKNRVEAQMILNHKDAIEFLVESAGEIAFDRYTILNLHALLANNLLADPNAVGRLRKIAVGIEKSVFHPLEVPQLIEECFDQLLGKAAAIKDPFEQAFFFMVHVPYLQPFDDVNKRVSRVGVNIPLIKANLAPLSFTEVPRTTYVEAVLGVYELNKTDLLKDVFMWAYERSAARYAAVRQSLGEPDPFRMRHRDALKEVVRAVIQGRMGKRAASGHVAAWTRQHIAASERERFREMAEDELLGLHEGSFARYQIRPSEFAAWQQAWAGPAASGTAQKPGARNA
jgi:hypothetical protein